jgi:glycosyltransferase involved in cell wall biosynthesis
MRVCLIASSRFPVAEPFRGGLEAHTAALAGRLIQRGHEVSVFAAPGSDPELNVAELEVEWFEPSDGARADVGASPEEWMQEHHAYLGLMLQLARDGSKRFDVVHNNCLHHLPIAMAEATGLPLVTTLHTPPVPWLESAIRFAPAEATFAAVSRHTARAWSHVTESTVVLNGIDTTTWHVGPGGPRAVWTGRVVPEKAPHLAIVAAHRAGLSIDLAGPVMDATYFRTEVEPLLGPDDRYVGHVDTAALVELVGRAAVSVVTPVWDEPYGLVVAEALACGTPVAAFGRGALPELVHEGVGALAAPGDVDELAVAISRAVRVDRRDARSYAVREFALERMVDAYERLYDQARPSRWAA